ncbi:MAG: SdrD B-like domain-containing protein, partial [Acidimicrobiia bacterium]
DTVVNDLDQDFGYQPLGSVGDMVWLDVNGDGVFDAGDGPLSGVSVTVTFLGADGVGGGGDDVVFAAVTDAAGNYLVEDLPYGNYTVAVDTATLPAGVVQTFDADGVLDHSSTTTLNDGAANDVDQDFGYQPFGSVGDTVWLDYDGDGVVDGGEPPLAGVAVLVTFLGADGVAGGTDDVVFTAVTDAAGDYLVEDLPYGNYTVAVDTATLPAGAMPSFDADGGGDHVSATVLDGGNADDVGQDFGYQPRVGSIGDTLWLDIDGDGILDSGDDPLPGVTVTVTYLGGDGVAGGTDDEVFTTVTDAAGNYLVENLPYGAYTVAVDTTTLPAGVVPTFDADGGNDHTSTTTLTESNPAVRTQIFGYEFDESVRLALTGRSVAWTLLLAAALLSSGFGLLIVGRRPIRRRAS